MKKMLLGIACLLIIFSLCLGNALYLDAKLSNMKEILIQGITSGDNMKECLEESYNSLISIEDYAGAVLRENKWEVLSKLFTDALASPNDIILIDKIIFELDSIRNSEEISFGAVF